MSERDDNLGQGTTDGDVDPLMEAGLIRYVATCFRNREQVVGMYLQPDLGNLNVSMLRQLARQKVALCHRTGGCPKDCELYRLATLPEEEIVRILTNAARSGKVGK